MHRYLSLGKKMLVHSLKEEERREQERRVRF